MVVQRSLLNSFRAIVQHKTTRHGRWVEFRQYTTTDAHFESVVVVVMQRRGKNHFVVPVTRKPRIKPLHHGWCFGVVFVEVAVVVGVVGVVVGVVVVGETNGHVGFVFGLVVHGVQQQSIVGGGGGRSLRPLHVIRWSMRLWALCVLKRSCVGVVYFFFSLPFFSLSFFSLPFFSLPFCSLPFFSLPFFSLPFFSFPFFSLPIVSLFIFSLPFFVLRWP